MIADTMIIWIVIIGVGLGTYLIRFSFLGIIGSRELSEWFLRHLRYVAVAVMPGLIAALAAFLVGFKLNSVVGAVVTGMTTLYGMQYLIA